MLQDSALELLFGVQIIVGIQLVLLAGLMDMAVRFVFMIRHIFPLPIGWETADRDLAFSPVQLRRRLLSYPRRTVSESIC